MADQHDKIITGLVAKMQEKVPAGKRLTAAVVLKVLKTKFAALFAGVDLDATKTAFIERLVNPPAAPPSKRERSESSGSDDDDDNDDDDSDDDDEEEEEEDEGEEDEEDDDDFESDDSDSEDDADCSSKHTDEEPAKKKSRTEEGPTAAGETAPQDEEADDAGEDDAAALPPAARAKGMTACLSKLHIRYRKPNDGEELAAYIATYLTPLFVSHQLSPSKFAAHDIKKYKLRKELKELKQDGGNVELDRNMRRGKMTGATGTAAVTKQQYAFLDDE